MSKQLIAALQGSQKVNIATKSPLTRLFRAVVERNNVTPLRWASLADVFFRRPESGFTDSRQVSQARFNLGRGITSNDITTKNFIEGLAVILLDKKRVIISIETQDKDGTWSRDSVEMSPRNGGVAINVMGEDDIADPEEERV